VLVVSYPGSPRAGTRICDPGRLAYEQRRVWGSWSGLLARCGSVWAAA